MLSCLSYLIRKSGRRTYSSHWPMRTEDDGAEHPPGKLRRPSPMSDAHERHLGYETAF